MKSKKPVTLTKRNGTSSPQKTMPPTPANMDQNYPISLACCEIESFPPIPSVNRTISSRNEPVITSRPYANNESANRQPRIETRDDETAGAVAL